MCSAVENPAAKASPRGPLNPIEYLIRVNSGARMMVDGDSAGVVQLGALAGGQRVMGPLCAWASSAPGRAGVGCAAAGQRRGEALPAGSPGRPGRAWVPGAEAGGGVRFGDCVYYVVA